MVGGVFIHFLLIYNNFSSDIRINHDFLGSVNAPTLIAEECLNFKVSDFEIYLYLYEHTIDEMNFPTYYYDEEQFKLLSGLLYKDGTVKHDLYSFDIEEGEHFFGDYQFLKLDFEGNGFIKTPQYSLKQLFLYEEGDSYVIATDMKLIIDGVNVLKKGERFIDIYDNDFIEDIIFREWSPRIHPRNTLFKPIKRVFPHDNLFFLDGKIIKEYNDDVKVPKEFINRYYEDKERIYSDYYEELISFCENSLLELNINEISAGLTGGFDSRITVAILANVCKKLDVELNTNTGGSPEHPDVVIAKKVADTLGVRWNNSTLPNNLQAPPQSISIASKILSRHSGTNLQATPQSIDDYIFSVYYSKGDYSSNNFDPNERKNIYKNYFHQTGFDVYKRLSLDRVMSGNTWYASRLLKSSTFTYPLFNSDYELFFSRIYVDKKDWDYTEFVYEVLKRAEPKLLDIPFADVGILKLNIEPYTAKFRTAFHPAMPFFWDYNFAFKNLYPLICNGSGDLKQFFKDLKEFDNSCGEFIDQNDPNSTVYHHSRKMKIIMDIASIANFKSFTEIENHLGI